MFNTYWLLLNFLPFSVFQASIPIHCSWISPLCCKFMQCECEGGFCSVLLVWNLLGSPHESGYIYLLPQSSPLAQCSTATTCTIHTQLWTEDLGGGGVDTRTCLSFLPSGSGGSGIRTRDLQRETQRSPNYIIWCDPSETLKMQFGSFLKWRVIGKCGLTVLILMLTNSVLSHMERLCGYTSKMTYYRSIWIPR